MEDEKEDDTPAQFAARVAAAKEQATVAAAKEPPAVAAQNTRRRDRLLAIARIYT